MAFSEFLRNLRIGAQLRLPTVYLRGSGAADSNARQRAQAAIWFTPRTVEGFDATDFPNLTLEQQGRVKEGIDRFRTLAGNISPSASPSEEQLQQGLEEFNQILEVLGPYIEDEGGDSVLRILLAMDIPAFVVGMYCETDEDSSGDQVFDIWLIVADEAVSVPDFLARFD